MRRLPHRGFPLPAQKAFRRSGPAALSGLRAVKGKPAQPGPGPQRRNQPDRQLCAERRRDIQGTQPGPVVTGHRLGRQLHHKGLRVKLRILNLVEHHPRQGEEACHKRSGGPVVQPEGEGRCQGQKRPQHQEIPRRHRAEQQDDPGRGPHSHPDGREDKTGPVKCQLTGQASPADRPEFGTVQCGQTSPMADKQFIRAGSAFRRKLRHAQVEGDQPAKHRQALGAAHQLQAGLAACHGHILEKADGGQRVQQVARHHEIQGPAVGKPRQQQGKSQHSPELCFCMEQLDSFRFSLHRHDRHPPPAP